MWANGEQQNVLVDYMNPKVEKNTPAKIWFYWFSWLKGCRNWFVNSKGKGEDDGIIRNYVAMKIATQFWISVMVFTKKSECTWHFFLVLPSVGPVWHSIFPSSDTCIKNSLIWMWLAAKQNKVFLCHRNENMKLHKFMFTKIK
jgi:hypothetical protein